MDTEGKASPTKAHSAAGARVLLTPMQAGEMALRNRMVMAPLTRCRAGAGLVPTDLVVEYYRQRAGAGLIISEATQVAQEGQGYPNTPGIYTAQQVVGWRRVTDAVHAQGGSMVLQLWHVGRISHPSFQPKGRAPVAPSAIRPAGQAATLEGMQDFVTPRALETDELPRIAKQYRQAAENALAAGFDGVELHAANGYLLDQFLRDGTNQRTDRYGGTIENRMRFPLEVLEAVLSVWPAGRVGVRLSPTGTMNDMRDSDPKATFGAMVKALNAYRLAYLHLVESMDGDVRHGASIIPAAYFRGLYEGLLMVNGGYDADSAEKALSAGHADMVSFGRLFIANPDLPERIARAAPLNALRPEFFYGGGSQGYTDYPSLDAAG
ncbi:MAG: alkene reductase [Gammaproteobacteria bacterium]|nr:alkene reductase [Gammaproteobacteria bacterium]